MTIPLGHLSLPNYPRISQNLKEKLVKIQRIISPLFTCGALPTHWMRTPFGWDCSKDLWAATNWYIELPSIAFDSSWDLANVFLNHFQLHVWYDDDTDLLSTFRQDKATHISDHIQEWQRWKRLIKATIPLKFLLEWFLKSLLPYISKDVSTSRIINEEEAILRAQHLDLIYSQSGILYEIIPDALRPTHSVKKPKPGPHADGVVGSVKSPIVESLEKNSMSCLLNILQWR